MCQQITFLAYLKTYLTDTVKQRKGDRAMFFITQTTDAFSKAITDGITAGITLLVIYLLFALGFLLAIVALITWVVKLVWNGGKKRKRDKRNDDWLYNAQNRQNMTYEYSDPIVRHAENKPKKKNTPKNPQWTPSGWVYNEKKNRWEGPDYPHKDGRKVSPTGWTFNEETQLWEPPESMQKESNQRWEWDEEKKIWKDRYKK